MSEPTNQLDPLQTDQTQVPMRPQEQVQVPMRPASDQPSQPAQQFPTPQPAGRGPQPANPQSNQDPNVPSVATRPMSKSIFDSVLRNLDPSTKIDPATGQPLPMPSRKSMTAHILAGAITSIIQGAQAGAAAGANAPDGPAGTRGPANLAAMSAGAQAGAQARENIRNQPQAQYDADQLRKYQTMKRNIDLAQGMLTLGNGSREAQDQVDSTGQKLLQQVDDYSPALIPEANRGLTHAEVMQKFPQMSQNNFIPIGHRDMLNDDGSPMVDPKTGVPYREPLFAVVPPNAQVTVTPELKEMFGIQDPKINEIPVGTVISLSHFLNWNNSHIAQVGATDALKDSANQIAAVTGKPAADVSKAIQADPLLRRNAAAIGKYLGHGNNISDAIEAMQKDKDIDPGVVARVSRVLGLGETDAKGKSVAQRLAEKRADELAAEKAKQKAAEKKAELEVTNSPEAIAGAANLAGAKASAEAKAKAAATSSTGKNDDGSWNPSSLPVKLVEGTIDPSQLSKRSQDYNQKLEQADKYSQEKYGKPFDIAKAQSDYKFANNPQTQNTLKYLNSLTGSDNKSGNLAALVDQSNKITRTDFPALNDVAAWARLKSGDPQMASYYAAVTEVADQVAKILQGGGSGTSDAKLKQASELFDKGFSKEQIVGVSQTLRTLLANRKNELVGDNRYLQKQYGVAATPVAQPSGRPVIQNGKVIGYTIDGKTMTPVQ